MARRFTSPYGSEDEEQLQIRRDRERASDVSLTPSNVSRIYDSLRTPNAPRMAEPRARSADEILDGALSDYFPHGRVRSPAGVGAGTTNRSTVPAGTTGVGVGTVADDPQPSTSRSNPPSRRRAGTSAAALASHSVLGGKEPRRPVARTVAEVRRRTRRDRNDRLERRAARTFARGRQDEVQVEGEEAMMMMMVAVAVMVAGDVDVVGISTTI